MPRSRSGRREAGAQINPVNRNYVRIAIGKRKQPTPDPRKDGSDLADQCLSALGNSLHFPPQLLILWATPAFKSSFSELIGGIRDRMAHRHWEGVPLIGSSVAACLFDDAPHERGAVLLCIASRFVKARVAIGEKARLNPGKAVADSLTKLGITKDGVINPRANQLLMTFIPGYAQGGDPASYKAHEIVRELCQQSRNKLQLFGGVSSAGLDRGEGWQFIDDEVYQGALAAALVESDVAYGTGLNQGLVPTETLYRVEKLSKDGRTIKSLADATLDEAMAHIESGHVFANESTPGEWVVIVARAVGKTVKLHRPISRAATLCVMKTSEEALKRSLNDLKTWVIENFNLDRRRLVGLIGISCVSRYRLSKAKKYNLPSAIRDFTKDLPDLQYAVCFLDGEIGIDHRGRSVFSNWSVADLFFADEITETSALLCGFDALKKHSPAATTASTVREAASHVLKCVEEAGYVGGMISLVLEDQEKRWIVALAALGDRWGKGVLPLTRRLVGSNDILARVIDDRQPRCILDTRIFNQSDADSTVTIDETAAVAGNVISFYAIPLLDEHKNAFGVLQVDLGDLSDARELRADQAEVLDAIGTMASAAVNRAIRTEELELTRRFDRTLSECLECETVPKAARQFVERVVLAINQGASPRGAGSTGSLLESNRIYYVSRPVDVEAHFRLWDPVSELLRLVSGIHGLYEYAKELRFAIEESDTGLTAAVFRTGKRFVTNLSSQNSQFQDLVARYAGNPLCDVLKAYESIADFPISGSSEQARVGVLCVYAKQKWFFTPSLLRSLEDVARRLSVLLAHVQQRADKGFLLDSSLNLGETPETRERTILNDNIRKLAHAAKAEVASCFLKSEFSPRMVLRAQHNWKDPRWIDAAWYEFGEGMTGELANRHLPRHISDLRAEKKDRPPGKYLHAMFGPGADPAENYEVLGFPLRIRETELGVVTMHRRKARDDGSYTGFATTDLTMLHNVAVELAALVYSIQRLDELEWRDREKERLAAVDKVQLKPRPSDRMPAELCEVVLRQYGAQSCAIHVSGINPGELRESGAFNADQTSSPQLSAAEVALLRASAFREHRMIVKKRDAATDQITDPVQVRLDNTLQSVFLPLSIGNQPFAVLEVHWTEAFSYESGAFPHYDEDLFLRLSQNVASHLYRQMSYKTYESALSVTKGMAGMATFLHNRSHAALRNARVVRNVLNDDLSRLSDERLSMARDAANAMIEQFNEGIKFGFSLSKLELKEFEIGSLIETVLIDSRSRADAAGVTVERKGSAKITAKVSADEMRISFKNIVENALNAYLRDLSRESRILEIALQADGNDWVATFSDRGPGMDPADVESINAGQPIGEGHMGLFLSSIICIYHFGKLHVESTVGVGTTVTMRIPFERL